MAASNSDNTITHKFLKTQTVGIVGCPFSGGQVRALVHIRC